MAQFLKRKRYFTVSSGFITQTTSTLSILASGNSRKVISRVLRLSISCLYVTRRRIATTPFRSSENFRCSIEKYLQSCSRFVVDSSSTYASYNPLETGQTFHREREGRVRREQGVRRRLSFYTRTQSSTPISTSSPFLSFIPRRTRHKWKRTVTFLVAIGIRDPDILVRSIGRPFPYVCAPLYFIACRQLSGVTSGSILNLNSVARDTTLKRPDIYRTQLL